MYSTVVATLLLKSGTLYSGALGRGTVIFALLFRHHT